MDGGREMSADSEQIAAARAILEAVEGYRAPDPGTVRRRAQRAGTVFPVIARSGRAYRDRDGRIYGETVPDEQRQADAGYWPVGAQVRAACAPMVVSVGGRVRRIYEVLDWHAVGGKWQATLGRRLTDRELSNEWPGFPYRVGDPCPTRKGWAYRPEVF